MRQFNFLKAQYILSITLVPSIAKDASLVSLATMSPVTPCSSESLRRQGNEHYVAARKKGLAPTIIKIKLEKAILCYRNALHAALDSNQKASASKNLARASWEICRAAEPKPDAFKYVCYHFNEAMKHFTLAISVGREAKSPQWLDEMKGCQQECLITAVEAVSSYPLVMRVGALEQYAQQLQEPKLLADCFTRMSHVLFQSAVTALEKHDFRSSLHSLKECYRPIEEMKRHGKDDPTVMTEARVMSDDVELHTASAESLQAISTGDELLQKAVMESEDLKMSLVMEVLDWYTKAVLLARDIEIEREAVASSRIGKVYDQILKMPCKAKKYFMHSVTLAHSLAPRIFVNEDWFVMARTTLDKYQRESLVEQQKREEEERQEHLKDLQEEVTQLRELQKKYSEREDHYLLISNIYKTFPPKDCAHKCPEEEVIKKMPSHEVKKLLLKACIHYHPDKQDVATHGIGWKHFAGEITKILTNLYERYK